MPAVKMRVWPLCASLFTVSQVVLAVQTAWSRHTQAEEVDRVYVLCAIEAPTVYTSRI